MSLDLFDIVESEKHRITGMTQAAKKGERLLDLARIIAVEVAMANPERTCTADAVTEKLYERYGIEYTGNWMGSTFAGKQWQWTGRFVHSKKITSHSRMIREWRYVGGGNG